ncbi:alpha/beta hydrolase [Sphaerisporangium sp. NPDC049003]|uniref:alpha/beta hydrolase n=1 Tax=Sphaerisporangium sp. NPDC049003 TaxID=3364517 RepID=UPI00371B7065
MEPERLVDPEELEQLAKLLTDRRQLAEQYYARAGQLIGQAQAGPMVSVLRWATDAPAELLNRASIARAAEKGGDPFVALKAFGLTTSIGSVSAKQGTRLSGDLKAVLEKNKTATPEERAAAVRTYFAKLKADERSWLTANQPNLVGGLDGAPSAVRFAANKLLIERALTHEQQELAHLKATDPKNPQVAVLEARVARLTEFQQPRITGDGQSKPRQFLLFDPANDGLVAEAFGDLAKAAHVAVMVPGITNRLDNYKDIAKDAEELIKDRRTGKDLADTAVITWLGYDTPEFGDSPLPNKAEAGAPELHSFRAGLELAKSAKVSLFAHSYGTLLSSKALQQGTSFNAVVFMGSPGLGSNIENVADLKLPSGTPVFAMRAPGDWVSYTQAHGRDPSEMSGIQRLATGRSSGHSQYYMADNIALSNLQTVLVGDGCLQTFTGSPDLDDEKPGAGFARMLVREMQSHVPQWKTGELGAALDPIIKGLQAGTVDTNALSLGAATVGRGTILAATMAGLHTAGLDGYFSTQDVADIIAKSMGEAIKEFGTAVDQEIERGLLP